MFFLRQETGRPKKDAKTGYMKVSPFFLLLSIATIVSKNHRIGSNIANICQILIEEIIFQDHGLHSTDVTKHAAARGFEIAMMMTQMMTTTMNTIEILK